MMKRVVRQISQEEFQDILDESGAHWRSTVDSPYRVEAVAARYAEVEFWLLEDR